jgi:hypothetical protein
VIFSQCVQGVYVRIMNKLTMLVLSMFLTTGATAQVQHAPTVEQCRADYAVWNMEHLDATSYHVLDERMHEMGNCNVVDPAHTDDYDLLGLRQSTELHNRLVDFLTRHNLSSQFVVEDAKGLR